jgi:hypothetical protein
MPNACAMRMYRGRTCVKELRASSHTKAIGECRLVARDRTTEISFNGVEGFGGKVIE